MLYEEAVPPTMTMVLGMGPKLLVKSAVERNLTAKAREDYTSGEVAQLCAAAVHVIMRSGVEYEEASNLVCVFGSSVLLLRPLSSCFSVHICHTCVVPRAGDPFWMVWSFLSKIKIYARMLLKGLAEITSSRRWRAEKGVRVLVSSLESDRFDATCWRR